MTSALAVHHITAEMVSGQRNIKTVFAEMVAVVQKLSAGAIPVLCGYNSRKFDDKVHERCPTLIISIRHAVDVITRPILVLHCTANCYSLHYYYTSPHSIVMLHHTMPIASFYYATSHIYKPPGPRC